MDGDRVELSGVVLMKLLKKYCWHGDWNLNLNLNWIALRLNVFDEQTIF